MKNAAAVPFPSASAAAAASSSPPLPPAASASAAGTSSRFSATASTGILFLFRRLLFRQNIVATGNLVIRVSSGEYVAFVCHGDAPIFECSSAIGASLVSLSDLFVDFQRVTIAALAVVALAFVLQIQRFTVSAEFRVEAVMPAIEAVLSHSRASVPVSIPVGAKALSVFGTERLVQINRGAAWYVTDQGVPTTWRKRNNA